MSNEVTVEDCTVQELKQRLDAGSAPAILDVRESFELEICQLPGAIHIPMGEIQARIGELDAHKNAELVVYCHHGRRSDMVRRFLVQSGFSKVRNLIGGIDAYSIEVDPEIAQY